MKKYFNISNAENSKVRAADQVAGARSASARLAGAESTGAKAGTVRASAVKTGVSNANDSLTELVFIVDRSGSMGGMELDTIGGVNSVLQKNVEAEGDAVVSVVLFDHETEVLVDRKPIDKVKPLSESDYWVRGCTALLDALGGSIKFIDRVHRYLPADAKPGKTIFVVTTDGFENASKEFTYGQVKRLIETKQGEGWEFLFLGANIDAVAEAERLGIPASRAATYLNDSEGAEVMYDAVAEVTCCMRAASDCGEPSSVAGGAWKRSIESDTERRAPRLC